MDPNLTTVLVSAIIAASAATSCLIIAVSALVATGRITLPLKLAFAVSIGQAPPKLTMRQVHEAAAEHGWTLTKETSNARITVADKGLI